MYRGVVMRKAAEVPAPDIREVVSDTRQANRLSALIQARYGVVGRERALKDTKELLNRQIDAMLQELGIDNVQDGPLRLTRYQSAGIPFIKRSLLVERNVSPNIIAECTVRKPFTAIRITDTSLEEDEPGEEETI